MIADYEKQIADDNFCDDWERNYAQRNLDRHKAELSKTVNRGKNRKCSYCSAPGHTRRTCMSKKGDMSDYANKALVAREKFAEKFEEAGLGIGALLSVKNWRDHAEEELAIIENIKWEYITHEIATGESHEFRDVVCSRTLAPTEYYPRGEFHTNSLLVDIADINGAEDYIRENRIKREKYRLVSPVEASFPNDFLTIPGCIAAAVASKHFEKERPYDYHGVSYDDE